MKSIRSSKWLSLPRCRCSRSLISSRHWQATPGRPDHFSVSVHSDPLKLHDRNKTLNGGRAERNEYILLHEFHRLKYICPDKSWGKKTITASAKAETADIEADPTKAKTTKSKKDKYKGGLVFEPKRGLWDKYILVMDFNSLYPSIIQEYNIDFTTVAKAEEKEVEDEVYPYWCSITESVAKSLYALSRKTMTRFRKSLLPAYLKAFYLA